MIYSVLSGSNDVVFDIQLIIARSGSILEHQIIFVFLSKNPRKIAYNKFILKMDIIHFDQNLNIQSLSASSQLSNDAKIIKFE